MRSLLYFWICILLLSGCGAVVGGTDLSAALIGKEWRLVSIGGVPVVANSLATAQFSADNTIGGSGSVNQYSGSYTLDGARLTISQLTATQIAGPAAAMRQETSFLSTLGTARSYQLTGSTLTITCDTGALVFQS